ncbi:MAG: RES domain-containing protein [Bryobacteraceae bacterium]
MTVYRLTSARFPRCDGEGARLYGGRWNSRRRAVVYAAATQSLAALEILAHTAALGDDYVVLGIDIPADLTIEEVRRGDLARWDLAGTRARGDRWLEQGRTVVLRVPSKVVPAEAIYVINPAHPDFPRLRIAQPEPFRFDERLLERWVGIR